MNKKTFEAVSELSAWVRDYGDKRPPEFIEHITTLIEVAKSHPAWHDRPTVPGGRWAVGTITREVSQTDIDQWHSRRWGRCYGPIPEEESTNDV